MAPDEAAFPTPQAAAARSDSAADLLERIGSLNARVERAQTEIQDLQTSDRSWVKKAGLVIGVLAGLVTIPKTVKENVQAWYDPPRTSIEWGKPLDLRYDVHDRVLRLDFPVLANNESDTNDSIQEISATLVSDRDRNSRVLVGDSDVQVSDQGKSISQPIPIQSRVPHSLVISLSVNSPFSEQALGFDGRRIVEVVFKTHGGKSITQKYCFDFDKEQGQEVLDAKEMHLWTPSCD
jgi:hypothetical protein